MNGNSPCVCPLSCDLGTDQNLYITRNKKVMSRSSCPNPVLNAGKRMRVAQVFPTHFVILEKAKPIPLRGGHHSHLEQIGTFIVKSLTIHWINEFRPRHFFLCILRWNRGALDRISNSIRGVICIIAKQANAETHYQTKDQDSRNKRITT